MICSLAAISISPSLSLQGPACSCDLQVANAVRHWMDCIAVQTREQFSEGGFIVMLDEWVATFAFYLLQSHNTRRFEFLFINFDHLSY